MPEQAGGGLMGRSRMHTKLLTLRSAYPPFTREPGLPCTDPGNDPDLWHSRNDGAIAKAQTLCRSCPRLTDCAAWAVETRQTHGVWGATTARERERIAEQVNA
jgi:hypothetical protein